METSEYLAKEFKALTDRYAAASRHIKELLYQISALPNDEKPDFKTVKKLLYELQKLEDALEYVTGRLHFVFYQIMILIEEDDLVKEEKPKKKITKVPKAPKTKRTSKTATPPKKQKIVKKEKKEEKEK